MTHRDKHIEVDISFEELNEVVMLLKELHGHDFSDYSKASLKRRVLRVLSRKNLSFYELKQQLTNNTEFAAELITEITVNVTEMFRDPEFYTAVREKVFPYLSSYARLKIWNAGCSTGEEVYSFAIMLEEAGLFNRSFLYGTDINPLVIDKARKGIYELKQMKDYSENFVKTKPAQSLSNYYTAVYDAATIKQGLKKNTLFALHNLATDGVFNEFEMVVCRNVLIYFEKELQERAIRLFYESLRPLGFMCLGTKESIRDSSLVKKFKPIDQRLNIYQKID